MSIKIKMVRDPDPVIEGEEVYDVFVEGVDVGYATGKEDALMLGLAAANVEIVYESPECSMCSGTGWIWSLIVPGLRKKCMRCVGKGYADKELKLYIWTGFESRGLAVAIAETEEEAIGLVIKERGAVYGGWGEVEVRAISKCACSIFGGD